jgi:hypothetical protein
MHFTSAILQLQNEVLTLLKHGRHLHHLTQLSLGKMRPT